MFIRAYLRASTDDQDASRARDYLETFVSGYGKAIASCYMENASGRPVDAELRNRVRELLAAGLGIRAVARHAACSTTTVMKVRDELRNVSRLRPIGTDLLIVTKHPARF
ncbi:hypothetical protein ALQ72_02523 [Pseudomonas syringae pv. maculicola]|uniref:hypothetical protein n=1 Tax=Pseudomonas syringae group genomosp. 3 TaxID=251701 RepID=UPI000F3D443B|nr:hypothetical protein [Pseudomonas syringae group genomosp. 3]RMM81437.1 hypothetical protein ALQ72_02523 [Pseudomonas syringae pv. maculicola]